MNSNKLHEMDVNFFLCTQTDFEKPGSWLQVIKQIQNI